MALACATQVSNAGVPTTLITGDDGRLSTLDSAKVELIALGETKLLSKSILSASIEGLYNNKARTLLANWIENNDTTRTIYHVHGWMQILSPSIFQPLKAVRDRVIISGHDFFYTCPNGSFSYHDTGEVCRLKPLSLACIIADCDRRNYAHKLWRTCRQGVQNLFADPKSTSRLLMVHPSMASFFLRSGVPVEALSTLRNPVSPFLNRTADPATGSELVFVGRLEATKGPDLALAAARAAEARLRIIGDGPMRRQLEAEYPEMDFVGRQPAGEIGLWIANARALIMPSRYPEPFGLSALEAMWSGLPVIVDERALIAPEVAAADAGLICDMRNLTSTSGAIKRMMSDDALVRRQGHNGATATGALAMTPRDWLAKLFNIYADQLHSATTRRSTASNNPGAAKK